MRPSVYILLRHNDDDWYTARDYIGVGGSYERAKEMFQEFHTVTYGSSAYYEDELGFSHVSNGIIYVYMIPRRKGADHVMLGTIVHAHVDEG